MSRPVFVFVSLIVLTVSACDGVFAQTSDQDQQRRERRERRVREVQQRQEALFQGKPPAGTATIVGRSVIYSVDRGFGNTMALLEASGNPNIQKELGLSEEQIAGLKSARNELQLQVFMQAPKYVNRFRKMEDSDRDTIRKDLEKDLQSITDHISKLVTPEQQAKTRTLVFQAMGGLDSPVINLDSMSALHLTDEQKEKARATMKEMEKERLAQMEEGLKLVEKAIEKGGINMSPEDRKALEEEGRALQSRIIATGKNLGDKLRVHLTDEQKELEKTLMANRPDYLPRLPRQMRGDFTNQYTPGLGSWVPGQGAPQDNTDEKRRRRPFPQKDVDEEN